MLRIVHNNEPANWAARSSVPMDEVCERKQCGGPLTGSTLDSFHVYCNIATYSALCLPHTYTTHSPFMTINKDTVSNKVEMQDKSVLVKLVSLNYSKHAENIQNNKIQPCFSHA